VELGGKAVFSKDEFRRYKGSPCRSGRLDGPGSGTLAPVSIKGRTLSHGVRTKEERKCELPRNGWFFDIEDKRQEVWRTKGVRIDGAMWDNARSGKSQVAQPIRI